LTGGKADLTIPSKRQIDLKQAGHLSSFLLVHTPTL
jgi:hypothetical protein